MSNVALMQNPSTVSLEVVWGDSAAKQDARIREISMVGCYIDHSVPGLAIGDLVEFKVHLPNGPWIALRGQLTVQDYPMGCHLSFLGLTDGDKRMLANIVFPNDLKHTESSFQAPETQQGVAPIPSGRRRILIAEDDPVTLKLLVAIAEGQDYTTVAVSDGLAAMQVLQQDGDFDAAMFDMSMPNADGIDLINIVKETPRLKHIPIAMISAERDPMVWDASIAAGASVFLPKPFTPDQIRMTLRMLESKARPKLIINGDQKDARWEVSIEYADAESSPPAKYAS